MDDREHTFEIKLDGIADLELLLETSAVTVPGGSVLNVPVRARAREESLASRSTPVVFAIRALDDDDLAITTGARFLGPSS